MAKIIDRGLAGPDDPIYKGGLRVSSVPGSSVLTKNSPKSTGGENPALAPDDPEPEMKTAREAYEHQAMALASKGQ